MQLTSPEQDRRQIEGSFPVWGLQIAQKEKDRQAKEDAAVSKWQEEQAAKQAASIAGAIARQQRAQADLEQVARSCQILALSCAAE